jgi:pimeloyl-ACP methyl ester carboxylesterase
LRIKQALAVLALAPVAIATVGWLYQRRGLRRDKRRYPPPGLLLSHRGRYIHVLQQGSGRPAIVFEAGLAATSISWARVQPLVTSLSNTCTYDRAGLGGSTPLTSRSSLVQMLDDLHGVAAWAGAGSPVVLVGHSFGSLLLLAYTRRFPEEVAGLVMVDPVSTSTWSDCSAADRSRLQMGADLSRRGAWLAEFGVVRSALALLLHGGPSWSRLIGKHVAGSGATTLERLTGEVSKLPKDLWPRIAAQWSRPQSFRAMAEALEALPACATALGRPVLPPELPVAILSAASATHEELRERDSWLTGLLDAQHLVIPAAGHWLHVERPEDVAEAIRWCVERARMRA